MDPEAFKHVDVGVDENGVLIYSKDGGKTARRVVPGGGSQPQNLGDIPGCQVWFDVSQMVGLSDDDPIPALLDLSGNGFDASQANALNQAAYKTDVQNGLAVARFNADHFYDFDLLDTADLFRDKPGMTLVYMVANEDSSQDYGTVLYVETMTYDSMNPQLDINDNHIKWANADHTADLGTSPVGADPASWISPFASPNVARIDYASGGATVKNGPYGGCAIREFYAHNVRASADEDATVIRIGAGSDTSVGAILDIGEWAVWDRTLNSLEVRQAIELLSVKWATI